MSSFGLGDIPFEGVRVALHTGEPSGADLPSDDAHVWWATRFPPEFGEIFYQALWSESTGGQKLGEWTAESGWVFYRLPLSRPWKVHQSRFRQRRRR